MFDVNNKQYILNFSTGKRACIFYRQGDGILIRWQSEDGKWQNPLPAAKNGLEGFSACIDRSNAIHMLYQDHIGNIIYMKYLEGAWNRKTVLLNKNHDTAGKQLHIACSEAGIYAFYVVEYVGKKYLVFQDLKESDSPVAPKTMDQVYGLPAYKVLYNSGNMTLFYRAFKDGKKISGFRNYEKDSMKWSSFQQFPSPFSSYTVLCAAMGSAGNTHICFQSHEEGKYSLAYCNITPAANKCESITLAGSGEAFANVEIYSENNAIKIFWAGKDGISCCTSHDGGNSFEAEQKLDGFDDKHTSCFSYIQNPEGNGHQVKSCITPGRFIDTPELAFVDIPAVNAPVDANETESLRRTIVETVKLLSGNINELRNNIKEMQRRLDSLDAAQQQFELDMNKYGIKDKFLENDMEKIRSELEILKARIDGHDLGKAPAGSNPKVSGRLSENTGALPLNMPLMPGTGFNSITAEFLKGTKK